jgi:predicted PurR-regulated permease PerM
LFFFLVLALIVLSYLIIKDFAITILNSIVVVIIFCPIYNWLEKKTKKKYLASLITTLLIIIIVTVPLILMINGIVQESQDVYSFFREKFENTDFSEQECETYICKINKQTRVIINEYNLKQRLIDSLGDIGKAIYTSSFSFLIYIPTKIVHFFIMIFLIFFIFVDKSKLFLYVKRIIPLNKSQQKKVVKQIRETVYGVVYGQIIIAILQGIITGIGLWLFGIPNPILLGILTAILALLPIVGASFIWIPASLYLIINGIIVSNNVLLIKGIGLIIYSIIINNTIEFFLKPKVIGDKSGLHPVVILLGILGGLSFFGISGLILGPVVLSILIKIIEIYETGKI